MITLADTVEGMTSNAYRERFVAEYQQTRIRHEKLRKLCDQIEVNETWRAGGAPVEHDVPLSLLRDQQHAMGRYLHILELRAVIEEIEL